MSLFSMVSYFCGRTNIPTPATVMGNPDTQILQIRRLLEEEGNDLAMRYDWQALIREATITTLADEDQGTLSTLAPYAFRHIMNGTFWDRTNKLPILGPLNDQQWQQRKALTTAGARFHYRIRLNNLLATPAPAAGYTWVFEYASRYWITVSDLTAYRQVFQVDTDSAVLPEDLLVMGLRWRWKEKGLDYAEDFDTYEQQVHTAMARDGGKRVLNMAGERRDATPGIFVPDQSWSL